MVAPAILIPFTFHWYVGAEPPLMTDEVKLTKVPGQIGLTDGTTVILTGNSGFTIMLTGFEVAGFPVAQIALEVSTHVMALVFAGI